MSRTAAFAPVLTCTLLALSPTASRAGAPLDEDPLAEDPWPLAVFVLTLTAAAATIVAFRARPRQCAGKGATPPAAE